MSKNLLSLWVRNYAFRVSPRPATVWLLGLWFQSSLTAGELSTLMLPHQVGHFQDETSPDLPYCSHAPREKDGLSPKRSRSDSTLSELVWSFLPPLPLLFSSSFWTYLLITCVRHRDRRHEWGSLTGNTASVNRYFTIQRGEHNWRVYSGCAGTTAPSCTWCRQMGGIAGSLLGPNEPYGNLLNCIHATGKCFPSIYHVQGAGAAAVSKALSHVAHALVRKAGANRNNASG